VRNVIATSTGPKISSVATVAAGDAHSKVTSVGRRSILPQGSGRIAWYFSAPSFTPVSTSDLIALELHRGDHRAHIDRLVERHADAQRLHAADQAPAEGLGNALLQEQPRAGTADLALVEPDRIDHAFHRAVDIGIVEHDVTATCRRARASAICRCPRWTDGSVVRPRSSR
jgi:hypothetical protein